MVARCRADGTSSVLADTSQPGSPFRETVMLRSTLAAAFCVLAPLSASADGLLYQLPKDGTAAHFDISVAFEGLDRPTTGTLVMSSVGAETIDGKMCRWIELHMSVTDGKRSQDKVAKLLIPEAELQAGKSPLDHVVRAWRREQADGETVAFGDPKHTGTPIPAFLTGPLKEPGKGDDQTVEVGDRELKCTTLTGRETYGEGDSALVTQFTVARTDDAPFGVAKLELQIDAFGKKGTIDLVLVKTSTNAKSLLPDAK